MVDQLGEPESCISLLSGENMGVLLLREGFGDMTESTRDDVRWFTRFQPQCCLCVSKVMKADTSESYLFDDSIEPLGHNIGVKRCTVGAGKYEICLRPCWTCFELVGDLLLPASSEVIDRDWVHVDGTATTIGLRGGRFDPSVRVGSDPVAG